jgi:hypothetical protein
MSTGSGDPTGRNVCVSQSITRGGPPAVAMYRSSALIETLLIVPSLALYRRRERVTVVRVEDEQALCPPDGAGCRR